MSFLPRQPRPARRFALRSPRVTRKGLALVAVPTALATGLALLPMAGAQSSSSFLGPLTDQFSPSAPPQRSPVETTRPVIEGLPDGVSLNRMEFFSHRHVMLYITSAAMPDKEMKVQVLLARDWYSDPQRTFPELWALDGMRARDDESGWTIETNIEALYADKNVNVIMPVGGQSSFYTDWQEPDNGTHYRWETFLINELIPVLQKTVRSNDTRGVVGLSMGGTAAVNLAERHPDLFKFVGSFSGYLDTTSRGMPEAILAAQRDAGGFDGNKMWGPLYSQAWVDHDPKLGIEALRDMTVYVSAGSGRDDFGEPGAIARGAANPAGVGLEILSNMTTQTFVSHAKRAGVEPIVHFRSSGVHSWEYWQHEMTAAFPHIAQALGLEREDRSSNCEVGGRIAEVVGSQLGNCTSGEYVVSHNDTEGRAQDFNKGVVYWSPETDAHALWGRIQARYSSMGGPSSWLGFPTTTELATPNGRGRYVHFQHGSIYWTPETGAHAIPREIFERWGEDGFEGGPVGFPIAAVQHLDNGGSWQAFEDGVIVRNPAGERFVVRGAIGAKYRELGGPASELGYPRSNEKAIPAGAVSDFEHGNIYWSPETGANMIRFGEIFDAWAGQGYEYGALGLPAADFEHIPAGGERQRFARGTIERTFGIVRVIND